MRDASENITLPHTSYASGKMKMKKIELRGGCASKICLCIFTTNTTHVSHETSFLGWCIEFDMAK